MRTVHDNYCFRCFWCLSFLHLETFADPQYSQPTHPANGQCLDSSQSPCVMAMGSPYFKWEIVHIKWIQMVGPSLPGYRSVVHLQTFQTIDGGWWRDWFGAIQYYSPIACEIWGTWAGWWFQPLWKILVSWDYYSQHMESHKIHIPNHQPLRYIPCSSNQPAATEHPVVFLTWRIFHPSYNWVS